MSSNEPVKSGCEVIYEMFHILNCGFTNRFAVVRVSVFYGYEVRVHCRHENQ